MTEHSDFLEEIVADDPANRILAAELRTWRDGRSASVVADERLEARFSAEPAIKQPARWRSWMQRPAVAFAASFAAVLILGIGAFALVARDSSADTVAATTSSIAAIAAADETPGEITLPSDLTEQTSYASCVLNELGAWFKSSFDAAETPSITATCGALPVPDLGPEADAYRQDLQAFANCLTGELDALLPELPTLLKGGHDGFADLENKCGEPPDPRDYGLTLPFGDLEDLDLSQFNFGDLDLDGLDFSNFDLEEFLSNLPEGVLPEDFDLEQLRAKFGDFDFRNFEFDFESCDPADLPDVDSIEDLEDFDFKTFFSEFEGGHMCGFGFFGFEGFDFGDFDLEGLDFSNFNLEGLDLEGLDIEELLADLESQFGDMDLEGLDLEGFDLEGLDLQELFDSLLNNGDFDFESFFGDGEFDLSHLFDDVSTKANA